MSERHSRGGVTRLRLSSRATSAVGSQQRTGHCHTMGMGVDSSLGEAQSREKRSLESDPETTLKDWPNAQGITWSQRRPRLRGGQTQDVVCKAPTRESAVPPAEAAGRAWSHSQRWPSPSPAPAPALWDPPCLGAVQCCGKRSEDQLDASNYDCTEGGRALTTE